MYKEAIFQKLRFTTSKGVLSTEQLPDLSTADLDKLVVALDEEYKSSGKKSFLTVRSVKDKVAKLRFDIALDILNTKLEAEEITKQKKEDKEHNEKIFALIEKQESKALESKSIAELKKMIK